MAICAIPGCTEHYACTMRDKGVAVSPAAMPTRHNRKSPAPHQYNNWERGIAGENRPGGGFMPYFDESGDPIRMKRYHEKRAHFDSVREQQLASTPTQET